MARISDVIERLESLKKTFGDIEVKIVNYHSDYRNDSIERIETAIAHELGYENRQSQWQYVRIGGEFY